MIIAVDFDGTCVTHECPRIGKEIGAAEVLKKLVANGHQLILWTVRSNFVNDGIGKQPVDHLDRAQKWFRVHNIPLIGVNQNNTHTQWYDSPKVYANLYIDDAAAGCPLMMNPELSKRPFVDWVKMEELLVAAGLIVKS